MPITRPPKKNRQRNQLLITVGVMAVLTLGVGLALILSTTDNPPLGSARPEPEQPAPERPPAPLPPVAPEAAPAGPALIEDNGRTLWASPTDGEHIALEYLPPGCDWMLHMRPAAWLSTPAGRSALAATGPQAAGMVRRVEGYTGYRLQDIEELLVGVRSAGGGELEATLVVTPVTRLPIDQGQASVPQPFQNSRIAEHQGAAYRVGARLCCFVPPAEGGRLFVLAPRAALHEVVEADGAQPPLRRELEIVAGVSDRERHATLLTTPSFLFTDGRGLFAGATAALRSPVFEFQPDPLQAVSVSAHWGEDFYLEMRGVASAEMTATRLAASLDSRVADWSDELQLAVLDLNPAPHGRRLVAKLPAMTRALAGYTRFGAEDRTAILNCYLPLPAGKNLLAAGELMLAQLSAGAGGHSGTTATTAPAAKTIQQKLEQPVSVIFARDTLEMAVRYLSDEIGTPIVIQGGDLQLEGITKNQSFGMEADGMPAEKVLLEILLKANPDKTARGPSDPKQKLVYVVKPAENGETTLYVTTRTAAAKRGEDLPAAFVE